MLLKKLEIVGFKSFADKMDFVFEPGMTCIVGPNGCGKSNVVDAIKWVLGEQRPRSLRGNEMLDVIYSGNESRPAAGMAEVALSVSDAKGALPTEFDEVRIVRRLYRSGDSEYLINGEPCRLRDVREMFMDTGVGKEAYSFIEQGKIDIILQTNPVDRRAIFEEAAGISRYKAKRIAAERKLERVEQNLVRLQDIVDEVARHSRSIRRQAAKARRYRALLSELSTLQVRLARVRFDSMATEQAAAEAELVQRTDALTQLQARRGNLEADAGRKEEALMGLERKISGLETELHNLSTRMDAANERIAEGRQRRGEMAAEREHHQEQIVSVSSRVVAVREERAAAERDLASLQAAEAQKMDTVTALLNDIADLERAAAGTEIALGEKKGEALRLMKEEAEAANRLTAASTEMRTLAGRGERLAHERKEIAGERGAIASELLRLAEEKGRLDAEKSAWAGRLSEMETVLSANRRRAGELSDQIVALRRTESGLASKYELIHDQLESREGYNAGVRHVMEKAKRSPQETASIWGTVADFIEVDLPYARAIEAALGSSYQALVARDISAGIEEIVHLKEGRIGRAAFVPLADIVPGPRSRPVPTRAVAWAGDLVRADARCGAALDLLLAGTVVVKRLDDALAVREEIGDSARIVTLEGDILEPSGIVEGGTEPGAGGVISQKSMMKAIEAELAGIGAEVATLEEGRAALDGEEQRTNAEAAGLRKMIEGASISIIDKQSEITQLSERERRLSEEERVSALEAKEVTDEIERIGTEQSTAAAAVEVVRSRAAGIAGAIAKVEAEGAQTAGRLEGARTRITELKIAAAKDSERAEGLRTSIRHLERQMESADSAIRDAQTSINNCIRRTEEAGQKIREAELAIGSMMGDKERLSGEIISLEYNRSALKGELEAGIAEIAIIGKQIERLDESVQTLRLKVNEYGVKKQDLAERVREEHGVDVASADAEADGGGGAAPAESEEEETVGLEEPGLLALPQRVEKLKEALARIGNVNLEALDELEELELRERFLTAQQDDLKKARDRLQEVIRRINKSSRELFEVTFNAVREHFNVIYRKLFGGGKADVFLEEGADVLDAGVEIVARPPGKELRSITLLSGGEKVLTAIALLFAIFKSRPSPFCVLDEIDAALDDANVGRFLVLLREYVGQSQFLIITHSKQTMAAADRLYGITMEEQGVSRKVTVQFEDRPAETAEQALA